MTLNIDLAKKVLEYIEAHPEEHDQAHFAIKTDCGTTCCMAGHAMLLSGEYELGDLDVHNDFAFVKVSDPEKYVVASDGGQEVLGLTNDQRDELFLGLMFEDEALDYLRELITDAEK